MPDAEAQWLTEKTPSSAEVGSESSALPESRVSFVRRLAIKFSQWGVETHGISPTLIEERKDPRIYQLFTVWFSGSFNLASLSGGTLGPLVFKLDLATSVIILLITNAICAALPAYLCVFGPRLGIRTMVLSRFSFGYYGAILPAVLNVVSMIGWLILGCIVGGQFITGAIPSINNNVGIMIVSLVSFFVSFFGYGVLHQFETYVWVPNAALFIALLGTAGPELSNAYSNGSSTRNDRATASQIISFMTSAAALTLTWTALALDYSVHHQHDASGYKVFAYTFLGLFISISTWTVLGAVLAAADVPSWQTSLGADQTSFGALVATILAPIGGFGKFLVVISSLSMASLSALTLYSFGLSLMCVSTRFAKLPRYVYSVVGTAITIPVSIIGARKFYDTFAAIINLIGYWTASYTAIVLCEHIIFRKRDFCRYQIEHWNTPSFLPLGVAALSAFLGSFVLVIPCMDQALYAGPIAKAGAGDIGLLVGFASAGILYTVFRSVELACTMKRVA